MTPQLQELIKTIDELSWAELEQLQLYINRRRERSAEERIRMIDEAVAGIREGMTQDDLNEMAAAMNKEIIEPMDEIE